MRTPVVFVILLVLLVAVLAPAYANGQGLERVELQLKDVPATARVGSSFRAQLVVKIEEGWHVYGLNKITGGPIPTRITLADKSSFSIKGDIGTPVPIVDRDSVFGVEVEYYESEAVFTLPITVRADTKPGKQPLSVSVRFQACNREMCLPPKVLEVGTQVTITGWAKTRRSRR